MNYRIIPILYGLLLMGFALYKGVIIWKENSGLHTFGLVKVFVRDQVIYFLACVLLY